MESIEQAQQQSRTRFFWFVNYLSDYTDFDFLWEPVPWESEYTHTWPSQHHDYSGTYLVPKSGKINYHFHSQVIPNRHVPANFSTLKDRVEFDYSWAPHPHDPPYIYVFGNQWWSAEKMPTVEYHVPGATERKYVYAPRAELVENPNRPWYNVVDSDMDYSWVPDPGDPPYIYVFGNQWWPAEIMPTVEYRVPGATERKYVAWPRASLVDIVDHWTVPEGLESFDFTWCPDPGDPPLIYQFGTQWQRTGGPVYAVPGATEVKYVQYPRAVKTTQDNNWTVPDGVDTSTFDWTWHPDATEPPYVYQFATQHQRTGGPQYSVPGATEVKYVDQIRIEITAGAAAIYEIDHMDGAAGQIANTTRRVRYFDNYRDTLIRLAKSIGTEHEYIWVCSSICDYTDFDFTWHPEQWQATMLHVFASDDQKFGDTFYMHVPTFAERAEKKALLEWYDCNFVNVSVPRRPMPIVQHDQDSHADVVRASDFAGPLAVFTQSTYMSTNLVTVPLWREQTKTIVPLNPGASSVVVPRTAIPYIKTQLYDYPYIDKTHRMLKDQLLDIVFIENGETEAEFLYQHLVSTVGLACSDRIKRIQNVNGRAAAYHAAARVSTTPWFFAVFAKLEVSKSFPWDWQPDRMQQAKHYIFHAQNPVNGLQYGHQAMIAYNQKLVLENAGVGLDFTLDQAHEVVPIVSGTANYYTNDWMCWRTAFREVIKLRASLPDVENEYRLQQWLTVDNTQHKWSMKGAEDAVEYYNAVGGDPAELRKSYEWEWLASYAFVKRSLVAN